MMSKLDGKLATPIQRASYDELCDCVSIPLSHHEEKWLEHMEDRGYKTEHYLKGLFETGRDRTVDADCPKCGSRGVV